MHILLVRHGESENNLLMKHAKSTDTTKYDGKKEDCLLTEQGTHQAITTGAYLRKQLKDKDLMVWSSSLKRAVSTAEHAGFKDAERMDLLTEYDKEIELTRDFHLRLVQTLARIQHRRDDSKILVIFGHSIFFSMLLSYIVSHGPWYGDVFEYMTIELPNCSVTNLNLTDKGMAVYRVGHVEHLGDLATAVHAIA